MRYQSLVRALIGTMPLLFFFETDAFATDGKPELSFSRRDYFAATAANAFVAIFMGSQPSHAKISQMDEDKEKIRRGYDRLTYLLDNWEKETTVCGRSDNPYLTNNGCERTPMKVMEYLGYRSTNDPLFKADKTMTRLEELVPANKESEYLEAIEQWIETAEEGNGMAFISSWGEANPGGGKDRVELFIERAKNNVIAARASLKSIIDILSL